MTFDELKNLPPISQERLREIEEFDEKFDDPDCPPMTEEQLRQFKPWYMFKHGIDQQDPFLDNDIVDFIKRRGVSFKIQLNQFLRQAIASGQL